MSLRPAETALDRVARSGPSVEPVAGRIPCLDRKAAEQEGLQKAEQETEDQVCKNHRAAPLKSLTGNPRLGPRGE